MVTTGKPTFKKYPSIENHYREEFMEQVYESIQHFHSKNEENQLPRQDIEWVSSEKVHGSNFSFIVRRSDEDADNVSISVGKRSGIVAPDDKFFPQARAAVQRKYAGACKRAFEVLSQEFESDDSKPIRVEQVVVFGELFGGQYKTKITGRVPIQKGVYYCEEFDFYAFDVYVSGVHKVAREESEETEEGNLEGDGSSSRSGVWLTFDEAVQLFEKVGFHVYCKPLARGKLADVLAVAVAFNTTVPATFYPHLPPMEDGTNICEGVVIKPANAVLRLRSGDRISIKKKNPHFMEVSAPKPRTSSGTQEGSKGPVFETEEGRMAYEDCQRYITPQRLNNCESKIGHLHRSTVGRLIGALSKDALEDFIKDNQTLWDSVKREDQKLITKKLSVLAQEMVKTQMKQLNAAV